MVTGEWMEVVVAALIAVLRRLGIWEGLGSRCCCPPPPRSRPSFRHLRLSLLRLLLCPPNRSRRAEPRLTVSIHARQVARLQATLSARGRRVNTKDAIITFRLTLELAQIFLSLQTVARITRQLVAFCPAVLVELVHADAKFVKGTHRVSDGHVQSSGVLSVLRACCGQQDEIAREEICEREGSLGR